MTSTTDAVARFAAAWRGAVDPPELSEFLPDPGTVQRAVLLELIRVDLRHRWSRPGLGKRVEQYRTEFDLPTVPLSLVHDEYRLRRAAGEPVELADYLRHYPDLALLLDDAATATFATDPSVGATTEPQRFEPLEDIDTGQRLDDFDLLTPLGSGAFARVFLARQRSMQRLVAVKVSENDPADSVGLGAEPQTLAQLDHDYIVRVFDQRHLPERRLRLLYMQYLPGGTLLDVVRRLRNTPVPDRGGQVLLDAVDAAMAARGEIRPTDSSVRAEIAALGWPETVAWLGARLASALGYADRRGVLHRDIKPANVLLTAEGVPKLADFNISYARDLVGAIPTSYFGGSLAYMSPEQLAATHPDRPETPADLDTRSDIYSLGVLLWELLTGAKPFRYHSGDADGAGPATALDAMIAQRRDGPAPDLLDELPPDTPAALQRVLRTCLAPDPADRWPDGATLAGQLELCLDARARDLVDPPADSWRLRLRRAMVPIVALSVLIPNALASIYNIRQNQMLIIARMPPADQTQFVTIATVNNVVAFSVGALLIGYVCRRLLTVPRRLRAGGHVDAALLAATRRDTLLMGDRIVAICFGLWVFAGLVWPFALRLTTDDVPPGAFTHFLAAQIVCGAIAVAYPFFLLTFYTVRSVYPMFLPHSAISPDDARQLRGLDRRSNLYLAVAASVPLLGVASVTFMSPTDIPQVIVDVRVLCVGGIVGFAVTYWLFRMIERDLHALVRAVSPRGV